MPLRKYARGRATAGFCVEQREKSLRPNEELAPRLLSTLKQRKELFDKNAADELRPDTT
jgi:hypothetical protein